MNPRLQKRQNKLLMRFVTLASAALAMGTLISPVPVSASTSDFVIHHFDAEYTLSRSDPQGLLDVVETISLTFHDYNRGILRAIPTSYKGHSEQLAIRQVSSTTGAPSEYTTYQQNGNTVVKIGSASQTITGDQTYRIAYQVRNVIGFYTDHDELFWDVNGDQWDQTFENVSVKLQVPAEFASQAKNGAYPRMQCFTGSFGSKSQDCSVVNDSTAKTYASQSTNTLGARQTLTIVAGFPKGYFRPSTWVETILEHKTQIVAFLIMPLLLGGWAFRRWRKFGRDPRGSGVVVAQYDAPDKLSPLEVGVVASFQANEAAVTATIVDLAIRKYLKIVETKKDRLIGKDKLEYSFVLLNSDMTGLKPHEISLLSGMFLLMHSGAEVTVKDLKDNKLYLAVAKIKKDIGKTLTADGYFRSYPLTSATSLWVVIGILGFVLFTFGSVFGPFFLAGSVVALLIAVPFAIAMPARTTKGVTAKEHIDGLKLYLNVAEKDRIKMLQSPDSPYAQASDAPARTVELFEKLLPYAIVLGVEKQWAAEFATIYTSQPGWYVGNWTAFNTGYLVGSINGGMQAAMNTAFAAPGSSGGSGFSGGGFSGGGGGGGGGGGW